MDAGVRTLTDERARVTTERRALREQLCSASARYARLKRDQTELKVGLEALPHGPESTALELQLNEVDDELRGVDHALRELMSQYVALSRAELRLTDAVSVLTGA